MDLICVTNDLLFYNHYHHHHHHQQQQQQQEYHHETYTQETQIPKLLYRYLIHTQQNVLDICMSSEESL